MFDLVAVHDLAFDSLDVPNPPSAGCEDLEQPDSVIAHSPMSRCFFMLVCCSGMRQIGLAGIVRS